MIKPSIPNIPTMPNLPGMEVMTDTLEFVKNLWGSMGIPGVSMPGMNMPGMNMPGMVMPTLSVEEINKRISDMKAVESWLGLNMNMLRGTIQALEVQAATISTLQTMGENFAATMRPGSAENSAEPAPAARSGNGSRNEHHAPEPTSIDKQAAADLTAPLVNAAAWWNMLQDQFTQAVGNAMTETQEAATRAVEKPKAKATAKRAAAPKAASTTTRKRKTSKG